MFVECRKYLIDKLNEAGVKGKVHTSMKGLKVSQENHIAGVIVSKDSLERASRDKKYRKDDNKNIKRTKLFDRMLSFNVIIGEYSEEKCQEIFQKFLEVVGTGLNIDGNFTSVEIVESEWVDKEDSILNSKIAVNVSINFEGGVYTDVELTPLSSINVIVEREEVNG